MRQNKPERAFSLRYNKPMNVYDFDKTIYPLDSSIEFYLYNLKRNPIIAMYWIKMIVAFGMYKLHIITKTDMKTIFYIYFNRIDNIEKRAEEFWSTRYDKLNAFYLKQKLSSDVIISASPEVLLKPICDKLGVTLIGSRVDPVTGRSQENCYGQEKVKRFRELYPNEQINEFYSDSLSDSPLANLSNKAFLVTGQTITDWPK